MNNLKSSIIKKKLQDIEVVVLVLIAKIVVVVIYQCSIDPILCFGKQK